MLWLVAIGILLAVLHTWRRPLVPAEDPDFVRALNLVKHARTSDASEDATSPDELTTGTREYERLAQSLRDFEVLHQNSFRSASAADIFDFYEMREMIAENFLEVQRMMPAIVSIRGQVQLAQEVALRKATFLIEEFRERTGAPRVYST